MIIYSKTEKDFTESFPMYRLTQLSTVSGLLVVAIAIGLQLHVIRIGLHSVLNNIISNQRES